MRAVKNFFKSLFRTFVSALKADISICQSLTASSAIRLFAGQKCRIEDDTV
ncbi:hypothetical protein SC10_B2orf04751 [Bacillus paralicheniformis]|nr:hypothetical protein SC10_B2orf04751 [Bacillus paralicheniformis]